MFLYYVLRKLQIEDLIVEKILTYPEIRQIVILVGGIIISVANHLMK